MSTVVKKRIPSTKIPFKENFLQKQEEHLLFIKQWAKNPKALGSIIPSSETLGKFIYKHLPPLDENYIVEVGAGTGSLTKTLLACGMPPEKLIVVELDPRLHLFLKKNLPAQMHILCGDARDLAQILPDYAKGHVKTILSGIPMMNLNLSEQRGIVDACFEVTGEEGSFLQFTYGPLSPLPAKKLGLTKKRMGHVLMNIPPASLWRFTKV